MDPMDSVERDEERVSAEVAGATVGATADGAASAPGEAATDGATDTATDSATSAENGVATDATSATPDAPSDAPLDSATSAERADTANGMDSDTRAATEEAPVAEAGEAGAGRAAIAAAMGFDPREYDDLAVTAPLKSHRPNGASATLAAELAAAVAGDREPAEAATDPLTPGATLAGYTIERLLRAGEDGPVYLATPLAAPAQAVEDAESPESPESPESAPVTDGAAPAGGEAAQAARMAPDETPAWRYIAHAVPESEAERLERVVAAGASGSGLLAPVAFARAGGRAYLIGVELPGSGDQRDEPAPTLSANERLRPVDALTACTQLAAALLALHHVGLAHLHVSPDHVTLYDGRVYLSGVEQATPVADEEEAKALYARDANFLARTVGALGGAGDVTLWDHDSSAQRSLREITARGEASGYATLDEVAEAGSLGLQMLMVAGVSLGADVRAVRLRIDWGAWSSVGRVRSENQDAWAATQFAVNDDAAADAPLGVFLVADGMGGEAHGEIASRLVARIVATELARRFLEPQSAWPALAIFSSAEDDAQSAPQVPLTTALEQAVKEANRRTRAFGARLNATTGSTVTALAVAGARAALAHLGDSRAYLLRDGQLLQLTEDHSLLARLEAIRHPLLDDPNFMAPRSVLYRSIGQEDDVEPDMLQFVLSPGDRIMMCSDGLWDEVSREAIAETLAAASDPGGCARALVALANSGGGHDNSTAVVLFIHANPADQPFEGASEDAVSAATGEMLGEPEDAGKPGGANE